MTTFYDKLKEKWVKLQELRKDFNKDTFINMCEGKHFPTQEVVDQYCNLFSISVHEFRKLYIATLIDFWMQVAEIEFINKWYLLKK